jgi:cell division control protein 6
MNIFKWNFFKGIANSLDFTDRILPRLELKPECKPKIVNFTPYSKEDIISIIKDRLQIVQELNNNSPIIEDRALFLCATKVASLNGDIRKVLDICR